MLKLRRLYGLRRLLHGGLRRVRRFHKQNSDARSLRTELENAADRDRLRAADALTVDVSSVRRIQIVQKPFSAFPAQLGVTARYHRIFRVVERYLAFERVAPDADNRLAKSFFRRLRAVRFFG